ncbi:ATP-binding cassette domain-containing protein [Kytococcus sedentarius]|uniref:ATP-binding cassette domain-containing protein n=1 Tax=Kytococcus sedentarius TaxID=1276 RepID=UPI0035BC6193
MIATAEGAAAPAARVSGLSVRLPVSAGRSWVHAAHEVDLDLYAGRVHALVGESGCGKSILASALIGLLPPGSHVDGRVEIAGHTVDPGDEAAWQHLRGHHVGLVPQSAATLLTPTRRVGPQVAETLQALSADAHGLRGRSLQALVARHLDRLGLPERVARLYPHQLSGGMAARVASVLATVGRPAVLLADEPTASLDVDSREAVLDLLREAADDGAAVLLITHDLASLGARAGRVDEVSVMYAGQVVDHGPADLLLADPGALDRPDPATRHPYTRALVAALPRHGLHPIPGAPPSLLDAVTPPSVDERLAGGAR